MKAFEGHNAIIQNNALDNWACLPGVSVILLGNDPGSAEAARERGFQHIPEIAVSEYGTPLLSAMFTAAQAAATTPFVSYINGDILLPVDFAVTVSALGEYFEKFLMVGERWDVDIVAPLPVGSAAGDTTALLREYKGKRQDPTGIDYFAFPTGLVTYMPEFRIGRPGWDNWLIWKTKRLGIPVVDVSSTLTVLHQNHGYRHVPGGNGRSWDGSPEAAQNRDILKAYPGFKPLFGTILHATHRFVPAGFRTGPSLRRVAWDVKWTCLRAYEKLRGLCRRVIGGP